MTPILATTLMQRIARDACQTHAVAPSLMFGDSGPVVCDDGYVEDEQSVEDQRVLLRALEAHVSTLRTVI